MSDLQSTIDQMEYENRRLLEKIEEKDDDIEQLRGEHQAELDHLEEQLEVVSQKHHDLCVYYKQAEEGVNKVQILLRELLHKVGSGDMTSTKETLTNCLSTLHDCLDDGFRPVGEDDETDETDEEMDEA